MQSFQDTLPGTARFWDATLPDERRATFRWRHLLDAPVMAVALADPQAYVERYAEPDKEATGLARRLVYLWLFQNVLLTFAAATYCEEYPLSTPTMET